MHPINLKITFMEILLQREALLDIQCWITFTLFHNFKGADELHPFGDY